MQFLNNPKVAIILVIVAAALILVSFKFTKKVTNQDAKDSIYLDEKEQAEMVESFKSGAAYQSGAAGTGPAAPAQGQ